MPPRLNRFERAMKPKSYTSFSFIFVLSFSAVVVIPLYFWFGLTCTIYTTTWYTVSRCVCVWCPFWIRPIYHVVHYCTRFSFFFFFFFFTIFYFLSVWVWLLELIRYSESVFFFFRLCASSAELVVEKNLFLPSSGCCSLSLFGRPLCQRRERASQAKMAGQMTTGRGRLERARCVLKTRKWSQLCCVNFFVERPDEKGQKSRSVHLAIAQHTHTDPAGSIY